MEFKRFQKVRVRCDIEGKVINKLPFEDGYRVSVQLPNDRCKWWIIVPPEFLEEVKDG